MAKLLDLVDKLIGDVLRGNIYTDTDTYSAITHKTPVGALSHIPNTDPRNLNINQGTPHPHVGSKVIPQPPETQMHGPPPMSRGEIYSKSDSGTAQAPAPFNTYQKVKRVEEDRSFEKGKAFDEKNRNLIYKQTDSNRQINSNIGGTPISRPTIGDKRALEGNPPAPNLLFDERNAPPLNQITPLTDSQIGGLTKGQAFDPARRLDIYKIKPEEQQIKSNIGGGPSGPEGAPTSRPTAGDLLSSTGLPPHNPESHKESLLKDSSFSKGQAFDPARREDIYKQTDSNRQINSNIGGTPFSRPTIGDSQATQGSPPSRDLLFKDSETPSLDSVSPLTPTQVADLRKGASFDESRRSDIYATSPANSQLRSNIGGGPSGPEGAPTSRPTAGDKLASTGKAPLNPQSHKEELLKDKSFEKGQAFNDERRNDIYSLKSNPLASNIGGSERSRDTLGQDLMSKGTPPSPRLDFQGERAPEGLRTPGRIEDNIYDDDGATPFSGKFAQLSQSPVPGPFSSFDIVATGHWLRNIVKEMGIPVPLGVPDESKTVEDFTKNISKGVYFLSSQFLLASLNPSGLGVGGIPNSIYNPLSLAAAIPLLGGLKSTGITMGAAFGAGYRANTIAAAKAGADRLLSMRKGEYVESSPIHRASKLRSPIGPPGYIGDIAANGASAKTLDDEMLNGFSIAAQVDGGKTTTQARKRGLHTNIYDYSRPYGATDANHAVLPLKQLEEKNTPEFVGQPGLEKSAQLFDPKPWPGAGPSLASTAGPAPTFIVKPFEAKDRGFGKFNIVEGVDAGFPQEDAEGLLEKTIPEGQAYMPFMFQDLRTKGPNKFLYFRAFLQSGISETFTVDWQTERYYGRVDQVPIYQGTIRNVNLTFDMVAWSPADLIIVYKKMDKLQSMVYPFYSTEGFLKSGPIIKMRIGDLIAGAGGTGLPGYINSMDFSYDDGLWNIKANLKVPRKISVSIGFTALHDGNPGTYPVSETTATKMNDDDKTSTVTEIFGTRKFRKGDQKDATPSKADIRKIFETVAKVK